MNQNLADRLSPTPTPPLAPSRIGSATTTNRPRASHALPPAQNAVTVAYGARQYDASEAKKEAAEMMAALGINNNSELMRTSGSTATNTSSGVRREAGTVGRSAGKRNSTSIGLVANSNLLDEQLELLASSTSAASPDLVKHLQTALDERERELAALQARFDQLTKDKNREFLSLQTKYDQLERESNEVERLLTGYQHEAEKSSLAVEAMKNKQRRIGDVLRTIYGDDWEKEILDRPTSSNFASLASPAQRKLTNRPSSIIRTTKQLRRESYAAADATMNSTVILEENPLLEGQQNEASPVDDYSPEGLEREMRAGPSAEEFASQMMSIRDLIRGMERRMIERDLELVEIEQRGNEHALEAEAKSKALTEMVGALAV